MPACLQPWSVLSGTGNTEHPLVSVPIAVGFCYQVEAYSTFLNLREQPWVEEDESDDDDNDCDGIDDVEECDSEVKFNRGVNPNSIDDIM